MSDNSATLLLTTDEAALPSEILFAECLRLLLRLNGIPFTERSLRNCEWVSPTGLTPIVHHSGSLLTDFAYICDHYRSAAGQNDASKAAAVASSPAAQSLAATVQSYVHAYSSAVTSLIDYLSWLPDAAYAGRTRPRYASGMSFPLTALLPARARSRVRDRLDAVGWLPPSSKTPFTITAEAALERESARAKEGAEWIFSSFGLLARQQTTGHLLNCPAPTGLDCLACGLVAFAENWRNEEGFQLLHELASGQPDLLAYRQALVAKLQPT